jgi:hypothetical protein
MFACSHFYFRLQLPLIIIHITCIPLFLHRTSASKRLLVFHYHFAELVQLPLIIIHITCISLPIHLISVLGVLGTQETSCILIAELLERDIFDLFLPEFDKPWVIHLRETCCCFINLCTWRPNTVYKNKSVGRHHQSLVC